MPEHVLKSKDLTETFINAHKITEIGEVIC